MFTYTLCVYFLGQELVSSLLSIHLLEALVLVRETSSKKPRLHRFKSDRDEIW